MEMIIKCPDCGKDLKVTVEEVKKEAPKVSVIQRAETKSSWAEIADMIHSGAKEHFSVGDEITCTLKDGTDVVFVAASINPYSQNEIVFVIKDCLPDRHVMNDKCTNKGGWKESDMRAYLNSDIYDLLPDDLKAVIKKRKITQDLNGTFVDCEDNLWLLSKMEVTGNSGNADTGDVHFELFSDERSRVKQIGNETCWYWLRSPLTGYSYYFWFVGTNGSNNTSANYSNGVAFGFLI